MATLATDKVFAGSIPELYDTYMVPLIFAPYAADLVERAVTLAPRQVLELAAGTGALTRLLAQALPASSAIMATDLNQPMLDRATAVGTARPINWRQADAQALPFDDASFDLVICQFGAMFFPDKPKAYTEARRVLRPGGVLLFNVWGHIEANAFAHTVTQALAALFPDQPPNFLKRAPHAYHDPAVVLADLSLGGFPASADCTAVTLQSGPCAAATIAMAYCQGTPLRSELEALGPTALSEATAVCTAALLAQYGPGLIQATLLAHVFQAQA